eukprot:CAMPEP_0184025206 /NCGR_PEP_ID=MMETSP0954-20121128/12642_1 /TAXON_ID=627963 /ORGANISM="Aplanochytrium sp, Strain PBS07" /LENGTH=289 /DNA_ID=CAMNT_0026308885 /DNA_START=648 /DNA_END=1514 /DNA_ORIENTATION=+
MKRPLEPVETQWKKGLENLTKKQLKYILNENGRSSAGSKNSLIQRLKSILPEASGFEFTEDKEEKRYRFCTRDQVEINLNSCGLKQPIRIIQETSESNQIYEYIPSCQIIRDNNNYTKDERPFFVRAQLSLTEDASGKSRSPNHVDAASGLDGLDGLKKEQLFGRITVVCGQSGCGKSRLLESLPYVKTPKVDWEREKAIISQFETKEEASLWLTSVGLASIPSWCKPYHILSTGERYRADIARKLAYISKQPSQSLLVLDDFCNNLDRRTASCVSVCLAKQLRKLSLG